MPIRGARRKTERDRANDRAWRSGRKSAATSRRSAPSRARDKGPTTVVWVRHGLTPTTGLVLPGRAGGLHLADAGREQAKAVAERIAQMPNVAAVYSSPLSRARETAAPIAARLGVKVRVDRALTECDFGDWTGRKLSQLRKLAEWRTVQSWPSGFRFPNGESFAEMQTRAVEAAAALRAKHPGKTIVAVSHADVIKAAVASAMGAHLDNFQRIVISPCSISVISYGQAGPTVLSVNTAPQPASAGDRASDGPRPAGEGRKARRAAPL